jgi:hypothetical protein
MQLQFEYASHHYQFAELGRSAVADQTAGNVWQLPFAAEVDSD